MRIRVGRVRGVKAVALAALTLAALLLLWWRKERRKQWQKRKQGWETAYARVACYDGEDDDPPDGGLLDATALRPRGNGIFFLETSCRVKTRGGVRLSARQACAVESAARAHPHRPVYLLVTAPASRNPSSWSAPARRLLLYHNVRVARIRGTRYSRRTPLAEWWADGAVFLQSSWPAYHASDALRWLTLWRFGGIYLDLDFIVLRSLNGLRNFACAENDLWVSSGVSGLGQELAGQRVARACLEEVSNGYEPTTWNCVGPRVITRVLRDLCGTNNTSEMVTERCGGITVFPRRAFYSIHVEELHRFYEEANASDTMEALKGRYAVHVWNAQRDGTKVALDSQQPYAQLARRYCPRIVAAAGKNL